MDEQAIQLVPAEKVSLQQRVAIMNAAYADYMVPTRVNQEQMNLMDRCFDISGSRSVVARARWESVGMALMAVRGDRAWISGVGVVPAWRRQGIGLAMMKWLVAQAAGAGARQIRLEVIAENSGARKLYRAVGFRDARELLTWHRPTTADPLPIPMERLVHVPAPELLVDFDAWHDQPPSWQRDDVSVGKMAHMLRGYRLDWRDQPAAYCLVGGTDDALALVDVGINPDAGLLMPGRLLLQALAALHWGSSLAIMNVPADDSLCRILAALRFLVTLRQIEMVLEL